MKSKMIKRILLFVSLFCLLFTMLAVSSSALTSDEDYRYQFYFVLDESVSLDSSASFADQFISNFESYGDNGHVDVLYPMGMEIVVDYNTISFEYCSCRATVDQFSNVSWFILELDETGDMTGREVLVRYYANVDTFTYGDGDSSRYTDGNGTVIPLSPYTVFNFYTSDDDFLSYDQYVGQLYYEFGYYDYFTDSEKVTEKWGDIFVWIVGALSSVQSVFFTNGSLTLLGSLAVLGSAIAVVLIIVNVVRRFLASRG